MHASRSVRLWLPDSVIVGRVEMPAAGFGSGLERFLSCPEREFVTVRDAEMTPHGGGKGLDLDEMVVARARIVAAALVAEEPALHAVDDALATA
jgi:hypothetical protein